MTDSETMQEILRTVKLIAAHIGASSRPATATNGAAPVASGAVAPDSDLDGPFGDVVVRKDPPRWKGESYAGQPYSKCSAEYLTEMAGFLDWKAGKNDEYAASATDPEEATKKRKYAGYARKDAARARGFALRASRGALSPRAQRAFEEAENAAEMDDVPGEDFGDMPF